jgi:subtilisin family serine protease
MKLLLSLCFLLLFGPLALAGNQLIIRAEPTYLRELASRFRLTILKQIPGHNIFLVEGPAGVPSEQLIRRLKNWDHGKDPAEDDEDDDDDDDDDVSVEADVTVTLADTPPGAPALNTDQSPVWQALQDRRMVDFGGRPAWTGFVNQPALRTIRVAEAHQELGTAAVTVAVIDTGIDPEHPLLQGFVVDGYDFVRDRPGPPSELNDLDAETRQIFNPYTTAILDTFGEANPYTTAILDQVTASRLDPRRLPPQFGHGTMVAGVIRLVAPGARIMPLKPFGGDGRAKLFNLLEAVYYAVDRQVKVINMSLSFVASSRELELAMQYAAVKGSIVVASVGNSGRETVTYPAGYPEVIGVASINAADRRSVFSNFGDNVTTLAAPGEAVITLYPGGRYAAAWGTSFSAPMVSGTVALMARISSQLNWETAKGGLQEAAPLESGLGSGRLDVFRAVRKAREF